MDNEKHINQLGKMIAERLEKARKNIIAAHKGAGQMASGRTAASIKPEVKVGKESLEAILWGRKFFQGLETGRAGATNRTWSKPNPSAPETPKNFRQTIYQWSMDKGISFPTDSARKTFAYFVAKKIANEGTRLFRKGGRADIYTPEIRSVMSDIDKMVSWFMEQEMKTIKLNDKEL